MQQAFDENPTAFKNWLAFPPSTKRGILEWIFNAKGKEAQAKRIAEAVDKLEQNIRANQWK
ncbi:MAG: hypothetical protein BalsKO_17070 [Balneolaceae bacterium]